MKLLQPLLLEALSSFTIVHWSEFLTFSPERFTQWPLNVKTVHTDQRGHNTFNVNEISKFCLRRNEPREV